MSWQSLSLTLANKNDADEFEDFLLELGCVSITYTDAGDEPILEPELNTTPLWSQTNVTALFEEGSDIDSVKIALIARFGKEKFVINHTKQLKDKIWEREWLNHFKPIRFGEKLWVCPSDLEIPTDQQNPNNVIVTLDPGLAFGTGTHETTALCLEELDKHNLTDSTVLDFGCGSGILAIAALKLGAQNAIAVDIDSQAITATNDNAERNDIHAELDVYLTPDQDALWFAPDGYDWVFANILFKPLIELSDKLTRLVKPGGNILLSGILLNQSDEILEKYSNSFDFDLTSLQQKNDWISIRGSKKITTNDSIINNDSQALIINNDASTERNVEPLYACHHCGKQQHFDLDALEFADGRVRCIDCDQIFNAYSQLNTKIHNSFINDTPNYDELESNLKPKDIEENILINALANDAELSQVRDQIYTENQPDIDSIQYNKNDELNLNEIKTLGQTEKTKQSGKWLLLFILSTFLLVIQFIHKNRAELALQPNIGNIIQKVYKFLPLELEPNWRLQNYEWLSNSVTVHPEHSDRLLLNMRIKNSAQHAQVFPIIRLVLRNRWNENIGFRDFYPKDYLTESKTQISYSDFLLDSRQAHDIHISVEDPGTEALDFEIDVCLERGNHKKIIQCKKSI